VEIYSNIDISVAVVLKVPISGGDKFLSFSSAGSEVMVSTPLPNIASPLQNVLLQVDNFAIPFDFGTSYNSSREVVATEVSRLLKI
jgi:hypothetical protein